MAEALGAVGAAASFVQLTDVSIRTCLYLYSFFSSLHKAQNEFQRHVIVLRDVHDAIQLIRQTSATHSLSPTEEALLRNHLLNITQELSSLEKVTAGKDPAKLNVRLRWVMKSAVTDRGLQELERRKTSLILLLQTITMRDSTHAHGHQDANQKTLTSLLSLVEQQGQQNAATRSDISARFDGLSTQMDSNVRLYKESLNEGFSTLTKDREVALPEECMEQVLRRVLDSYILPRVEKSFSETSKLQNAATLRLIQEAVGQATEQILNQVADTKRSNAELEPKFNSIPSNPEQVAWSPPETRTRSQGSPYHPPLKDIEVASPSTETSEHTSKPLGKTHNRKTNKWSYWTSAPPVGTFRIQYGTQLGHKGRFWTIQIDFWPSITFLSKKCMSIRYSNNYDPQEYIALFPSLAIYPIIPNDDPIWKMIEYDDIKRIRVQFKNNKNGPFDQSPVGLSLLTFAVMRGSLEAAQFLLTQGADPTRATASGADALQGLVFSTVYHVIQPHTRCSRCYLLLSIIHPLFFSLFHSFIASGCDIDDCSINIFYFLGECLLPDELLTLQNINPREIHDVHPIADYSQLSSLYFVFDEGHYLTMIRQVAQFLRFQGLDLAKETVVAQVSSFLENPSRLTLPILRECGVTGNYQDPFCDHMASILYQGLYPFHFSGSKYVMDNLIDIISSGADIYDVELAHERWIDAVDDDGVMSPTAYAKANGFASIWKYALQQAGYDPDVVFLEDERRRREFRRLHGATSSAVEMENPPSSTLRRRLV